MLKNIRLHLDPDDSVQEQIEEDAIEYLDSTFKKNLSAFRTGIPPLLPYIQHVKTTNISVFCNKFGETNFVDYGVGRTLYGLEPRKEIEQQVEIKSKHCCYVAFNDVTDKPSDSEENQSLSELPANVIRRQQPALPEEVETLVILGIGLGHHILKLLTNHQIKNVIVYEPELQYFKSSNWCTPWHEILKLAKAKGTGVFIQVEKDGRDIVADITELREHFPSEGFFLYKHYNHPIFNALEHAFTFRSWQDIKRDGINFQYQEKANDYLPIWSQSIDIDAHTDVSDKSRQRLNNNLEAFKKYFPSIYSEFKDYQPKTWFPVENSDGEINVIKRDSLISWYAHSPRYECELNFQNYSEQPNKDGLILGYSGTKLKHYIHYKFVAEMEELLKGVTEETGHLPETLKSMILFGVGVGYQIEQLFENHKVEKLFLCEPNRDFFFASMYAIDWQKLLQKIDEEDGRLYINIGDDGKNLFRDLLDQFYAIGPYVLASTYFYQSYYNSALVQAIAQLREQLQIVIAMGEYYDHAKFGIAHTTEVIARNYPLLIEAPAKQLSYSEKEVPIFLVGNGPSLDHSLDTIKEWQSQAIIVSCGTALMPLHKNGIVPDFHTEIEQNRSTYDWICKIGDFDYLKKISLVSANGIHPDTCSLFKDVFIALKEGESSTVSAVEVLGKEKFSELKFAFPTVSNFSLNLFSLLGFNQIYLFGVDLGFADKKQHHSKQSGYYKKSGVEAYDYEAKNNTSMVVPGNFRKTVFTKHEFKVSCVLMEQLLAQRKLDCFNCADGARIVGAQPLPLENILLTATEESKRAAAETIKNKAFATYSNERSYLEAFSEKYKQKELEKEVVLFLDKSKNEFFELADVEKYVNYQKELLFASYKRGQSLLFYMLYGTMNYANSVLIKLSGNIEKSNQARLAWSEMLDTIHHEALHGSGVLDTSSSMFQLRLESCLKNELNSKSQKLAVVTNSGNFLFCMDVVSEAGGFTEQIDVVYLSLAEVIHKKAAELSELDLVCYHFHAQAAGEDLYTEFVANVDSLLSHDYTTLVFVSEPHQLRELVALKLNIRIAFVPGGLLPTLHWPNSHDGARAQLLLQYVLDFDACNIIIFKALPSDASESMSLQLKEYCSEFDFYELPGELIMCPKGASVQKLHNGHRPQWVLDKQVDDTLALLPSQSDKQITSLVTFLQENYHFNCKLFTVPAAKEWLNI